MTRALRIARAFAAASLVVTVTCTDDNLTGTKLSRIGVTAHEQGSPLDAEITALIAQLYPAGTASALNGWWLTLKHKLALQDPRAGQTHDQLIELIRHRQNQITPRPDETQQQSADYLIHLIDLYVRAIRGDAFALTSVRAGTGTGSVVSAPSGIDCGSDCSETYDAGSVVTLTATPAANSVFDGWSGAGCSGTGTCVVPMNAATTVTATFTRTVTLLVTRPGDGTGTVTSTPAGINCGADCTEVYNEGTVVTLTATPAVGSTFRYWLGGRCSANEPIWTAETCTVTMNDFTQVIAVFDLAGDEDETLLMVAARSGATGHSARAGPSSLRRLLAF